MIRNWHYPTAAIVSILLVWHFAVEWFSIPNYLIPPPAAVIERLWQDRALMLYHSGVTLRTTLGGFILSVVVGIPLGTLLVWSRLLDKAVTPLLVISQAFPKVAIAPLIVIWFGLGMLPKILIAFSVAFFPIVVSTVAGMRSVETDLLDLARSMQGTPLRTYVKIRMPFALPHIFAGLKVAIAFAVVGAVVGEWVGTDSGLGYLMLWANANLDTPLLFAILVFLMLISLVLYYAVEWSERLALPWHVSIREAGVEATP